MSAQQYTTEQIYAELLAAEQAQQQALPGATPPQPQATPPPGKIKVGDREFDLTNTAGINQAIAEQQDEFRRLQTLMAEQQHMAPQPQTQQTQAAPVAQPQAQPRTVKRKAWTPETMAEEIKQRALPEVFDEMLGQQLGVDSLLETFKGMALKLQQQEQAFLAVAPRIDALDQRLTQESMTRASQNFLNTHEDYVPSNENMQMVENYLRKNNLPWTEQGLHLAYLSAKTDNMLKLEQATQTQQTQQTQQVTQQQAPQGATAQPSLRSGNAGLNTENAILEKFNQLSLDEQRRFIENFGQ